MFKAKNKGYLHITLFISLICSKHGYIFIGKLGIHRYPIAKSYQN